MKALPSSLPGTTATGILALLDLPVGTSLTIDGKAIVLKRDDFVAFSSIASDAFHLVTVQCPSSTTTQQQSPEGGPRHGFIFLSNADKSIVAHRYDALTEEVSSEPIDDATCYNLETTIRRNQMEQPRVIPLPMLFSEGEQDQWKEATSFIDSSLLRRRNLSHGMKIVPGAYVDADDGTAQQDQIQQANNTDGYHLSYPPIPVLGVTPLKHTGTKRFLLTLSPSERTKVLTGGPLAALHRIIATYYDADWKQLLGDLQIAYVMFLHLQCLTSMEHWRDLVAVISLAATDHIDESCIDLFSNFASLLQLQMNYMDKELFDDAEYSGGNFFVAAVGRLISGLQACNDEGLRRKAAELQTAASGIMSEHESQGGGDEEDAKIEELKSYQEDDESDDEPVVLSNEDIEASLARSAGVASNAGYPVELHRTYPLLFASVQPHEDVIMACSRILDTRVDVSLVREAAAYLAEVEANE
jgi:hypothetical protein